MSTHNICCCADVVVQIYEKYIRIPPLIWHYETGLSKQCKSEKFDQVLNGLPFPF